MQIYMFSVPVVLDGTALALLIFFNFSLTTLEKLVDVTGAAN